MTVTKQDLRRVNRRLLSAIGDPSSGPPGPPGEQGPPGVDGSNFETSLIAGHLVAVTPVLTTGNPTVIACTATTLGTQTGRTVAPTNVLTAQRRMGYVSAATANSLVGVRLGTPTHHPFNGLCKGFTFTIRAGVSDVAGVSGARCFIGIANNMSAPTNVEPTTLINAIGIAQLSTDASQWYLICAGGTAQGATPLGVGLGAPTATNTVMKVVISSTALDTYTYTVTNEATGVSVSGSRNVNTPSSTTLMGCTIWRTNNAAAAAVGLDFISIVGKGN